jgi:hypothetical protein
VLRDFYDQLTMLFTVQKFDSGYFTRRGSG